MDGRVPVIDSSCRVLNSKQFKKDCDLLRLFAMVSARAAEAEDDGIDEGVAQDSEIEYIRLERLQTLNLKQVAKLTNFAITPKTLSAKSARRLA